MFVVVELGILMWIVPNKLLKISNLNIKGDAHNIYHKNKECAPIKESKSALKIHLGHEVEKAAITVTLLDIDSYLSLKLNAGLQ